MKKLELQQIYRWVYKNPLLYRWNALLKDSELNPSTCTIESGQSNLTYEAQLLAIFETVVSQHLPNFIQQRMQEHKSVKVEELGVFQLFTAQNNSGNENRQWEPLNFTCGFELAAHFTKNILKQPLQSNKRVIFCTSQSHYLYISSMTGMPEETVKKVLRIFSKAVNDLLDLGSLVELNFKFVKIGLDPRESKVKVGFAKEFIRKLNLPQTEERLAFCLRQKVRNRVEVIEHQKSFNRSASYRLGQSVLANLRSSNQNLRPHQKNMSHLPVGYQQRGIEKSAKLDEIKRRAHRVNSEYQKLL